MSTILRAPDLPVRLEIGEATIDVSFDSDQFDLDRDALLDWVTQSALAVTSYFGRFPVTYARVRILLSQAPRRAHVQPTQRKFSRKATTAKKAPKGRVTADPLKPVREGSKTSKILDLPKRPGGVTSKELIKATGKLPHSVRGFLSGTVSKNWA